MGILVSYMRRFNIENRAYKQISKIKPDPAPLSKRGVEQLEKARQVDPKFLEDHYKVDKNLNKYLQQVFITSSRDQETCIDSRKDINKPLPKKVFSFEENESSFYRSKNSVPGKCSLQNVLEFLSKNATDPNKYSSEYIATQYKLDQKAIENILHYYQIFVAFDIEDKQIKKPADLEQVRFIYPIPLKDNNNNETTKKINKGENNNL
ncbi:protein NDUFAF4 homolog [Prorops nasuta]|uniref:protein NDUFAF4 homolog n=1 Tax=Prorops nasuta TaxID=863751 RepID=UPI0034CD13B8